MGYLNDFLGLLDGECPQRVIWTADLDYWITGREVEGTADPAWRTEAGFLELCNRMCIMPYYFYGSRSGGVWQNAIWLAEAQYDATIALRSERNGNKTTTVYTTPVGELVDQTEFMPSSCSQAHTKFPVQSNEDLEVFRYLIEHRRMEPVLVDRYAQRMAFWAKHDGLPSIAMPRSPLSAFFYEWAGIMNGVYLLMDHPDRVREIFALMHEQEKPAIDAVCRLAPPLVHFADNMSSDNMAGFYREFMEQGHRYRIERFHGAGTKCVVHLDGVVRGLLPQLASAGFDAIEALTPQPGGDLEVEQMREAADSDRVILWGGVPGVLFAPPYGWKDMAEHVAKTLDAWRGTRFVLGVADQIPPDGEIEYCRRIAEIVGR